jgi:hypothetical protein
VVRGVSAYTKPASYFLSIARTLDHPLIAFAEVRRARGQNFTSRRVWAQRRLVHRLRSATNRRVISS